MLYKIFFTVSILLASASIVFAQKDTVIINKRVCCPPTLSSFKNKIPHIQFDSLLVIDTLQLDHIPYPKEGYSNINNLIEYPEIAVNAGITGQISIEGTIDKEGNATNLRVVNSDAEIFNNPTIEALRNIMFIPAKHKTIPVDVRVIIRVKFYISNKSEILFNPSIDVSEVTLSHRPGFVAGPSYKIVLRKNGDAIYMGDSFVERIGIFHGSINSSLFGKIESLLWWTCYFDSTHENIIRTHTTDMPFEYVTATSRGLTKRGNTNDDDRYWLLAKVIEEISNTIGWEKVNDEIKR
jgi:TonB family protein